MPWCLIWLRSQPDPRTAVSSLSGSRQEGASRAVGALYEATSLVAGIRRSVYDRRVPAPAAPLGTTPANALVQMEGARYQTVRLARLRAIATVLNRKRLSVAAPANLLLIALLYAADVSPSRILAIAALTLFNVLMQLSLVMRARGAALSTRLLFVAPMIALLVQLGVLAVTGGLSSPLVPIVLTVVMSLVTGHGRSRESAVTLTVAIVGMLVLLVLPPSVLGPPFSRGWHVVLTAWALAVSLVFLTINLLGLTDAYQAAGEQIEKMREDVLRQALDRASSLEAIGAKLGHELKNPLAAIKGLAQLLARQSGDARTMERLGVMTSEVTRMEGIVREYLSFSRPLEELVTARLDVAALVDEVLQVVEGRAQLAGVSVGREGEGIEVEADGRRLREALLNLVANALEATPSGGVVTVTVAQREGGAELAVRDSGKGLTVEQLARVGTPFYTTREGGTGLGVVLARTVVMQHGGELRYESEPGRGTCARVLLPVRATCPALRTDGRNIEARRQEPAATTTNTTPAEPPAEPLVERARG